MSQPTVYVYDPDTGELVTPEELARRQAERAIARKAVRTGYQRYSRARSFSSR